MSGVGEEGWRWERAYKPVEEDEEVVEDEYEVVEEDEEVVESDKEVIDEDEEVVAGPMVRDEVEAFLWGLEPPPKPSYHSWLQAVQEFKRLLAWKAGGARVERLRRARVAVFEACPERPDNCPIYRIGAKCPVSLEAECRPIAWLRQHRKPKKTRAWFRKTRGRK